MALVCILFDGRLTFLPVTLKVLSASKYLLLLRTSTPLVVHRIRIQIAVWFRLSLTSIGCSSSYTWMTHEYVYVIRWSSSIIVKSKVIEIRILSTSVVRHF